MRYGLKMGNGFLLTKDEATDAPHGGSAIWPFLLVDYSKSHLASPSCAKSLPLRFHMAPFIFIVINLIETYWRLFQHHVLKGIAAVLPDNLESKWDKRNGMEWIVCAEWYLWNGKSEIARMEWLKWMTEAGNA